jgi:hypothetical protein
MNTFPSVEQLLIVDTCSDTQARIAQYEQDGTFSVMTGPDPVAAILDQGMAA